MQTENSISHLESVHLRRQTCKKDAYVPVMDNVIIVKDYGGGRGDRQTAKRVPASDAGVIEERTDEERTTVDERKQIYKKADPCGCMSLL